MAAEQPKEEVKVELGDPESRLYVSNLKWELDDENLKEIFGQHGKVLEARIVRDKRTGWSRGYGFVTFDTKDEADKALDALNGKDVRERPIRVEKARSTGPTQSKTNGDQSGAPRARGRGRAGGRGRGRRFRGRGRGRRARGDDQPEADADAGVSGDQQ